MVDYEWLESYPRQHRDCLVQSLTKELIYIRYCTSFIEGQFKPSTIINLEIKYMIESLTIKRIA